MYGIASLLNAHNQARVESIWFELESFCGLVGVKQTPIPHFSWQIAEEYDFKQADEVLTRIARQTPAFFARTTGLALFTGLNPVVYIPLVRDMQLSTLHQELWEQLQPASRDLSPYYSPASWIPHITLAYGDVEPEKLACLMERLSSQDFQWEVEVDNLVYVFSTETEIGSYKRMYQLGG